MSLPPCLSPSLPYLPPPHYFLYSLPEPLLPHSPGFRNGNGLAVEAFPGAVAQPGKVGEEHGADKAGSALGGSSSRLPQGRTGESLEVEEKDHKSLGGGEEGHPCFTPISAGTPKAFCLTSQLSMAMEPQEEAGSLGSPHLPYLSPQVLEVV